MPGLQCEGTTVESPIRKNRLSLKFLQKKETKRALDFNEPQPEEPSSTEPGDVLSCDQDVSTPCPSSVSCSKTENLVPFVGLNNLGNTCYLNSILQVLYYCPGFKEGVKSLFQLSKSKDKQKEDASKTEEETEQEGLCEDSLPVHMELLHSFYSLISSVEQLQSSFLFNPEKYSEGELATPPRRILSTLRQLNPMYEGYLQHDAQEVLQCILAYIQEACDTIKKELNTNPDPKGLKTPQGEDDGPDGQLGGKRKSDTEVGNAKKKPKSNSKHKKSEEDNRPVTRSKRKSSDDGAGNSLSDPKGPAEAGKEQEEVSKAEDEKSDTTSKEKTKRKKRVKLGWLRPSRRQPSIFSKFRSMGRISTHVGDREENKESQEAPGPSSTKNLNPPAAAEEEEEEEVQGLNVLKRLFQGQLVLRTRCLECECCTERREDFQDISVPVQEDEPSSPDCSSEVSPDPKPEQKTLKWAISHFASVERIVGEDKYFCETCHHYAEAERSLLFDRTPDVVTIHLKCFSASGSETDPYAGLSKVNTPLLTPLKLSLKEWSTRSCSSHHYRLFAVVMHSGVTISSGHYTTYIRMSDLHHTQLKCQSEPDHDPETRSVKKEEPAQPDYDDGEVSFSVSAKAKSVAMAAKAGAKRVSEGVGLLGGQRSTSSYEISTNKAVSVSGCPGPVKKEREEVAQVSGDSALQNLLDYEGKWMLFDDSEVRLFEEEEFLRACSPETSSTSTPYLLFYHKVSGDMD